MLLGRKHIMQVSEFFIPTVWDENKVSHFQTYCACIRTRNLEPPISILKFIIKRPVTF